MVRRAALIACFALSTALADCAYLPTVRRLLNQGESGPKLPVQAYTVAAPQPSARFAAGAHREDITPPPGFPTGGHGPGGSLARGYWTRLYARAFFFEDEAGHTLVLVSCDTFAIPAGLKAEVARRVALEWGPKGIAIPPESVIIAATHTHQGPGNYMTAKTHNQGGSSFPGFSCELFDFLAKKITAAIDGAINDSRQPDRQVELVMHTGRVDDDLVRNRSPRVFMLNHGAVDLMKALNPQEVPDCVAERWPKEPTPDWDIPGCPRLRAVDRGLTVLEMCDAAGTGRRIGLLVFFAAHPTVLVPDAPMFSADFTGYAMARLERMPALATRCGSLTSNGPAPVAGFFNGAEGDITARRTQRNIRDVRKLGYRFATDIAGLLAEPPLWRETNPAIDVRSVTIKPAKEKPVCDSFHLAKSPVLGAAGLGGAEGDRLIFYDLGWREGVRDRARKGGQGPKLPAFDSKLVRAVQLTSALSPPDAFPRQIPVTLASIGKLEVAAVPVELSTATGQMIRKDANAEHGRFEVIGLANEYQSYVASPDEYCAQDFMGAETIWGPQEGPYLACLVNRLRTQGGGSVTTGEVGTERFSPGPVTHKFGPDFSGDPRALPDEELEVVLSDAQGVPERGLPWFSWYEPVRSIKEEFEATCARRVQIWRRDGADWTPLKDDRGAEIITMLLARKDVNNPSRRVWSAIWAHPRYSPSAEYAFVVTGTGTAPQCSVHFTRSSVPIDGRIASVDCAVLGVDPPPHPPDECCGEQSSSCSQWPRSFCR